jgi:hypothetical protein
MYPVDARQNWSALVWDQSVRKTYNFEFVFIIGKSLSLNDSETSANFVMQLGTGYLAKLYSTIRLRINLWGVSKSGWSINWEIRTFLHMRGTNCTPALRCTSEIQVDPGVQTTELSEVHSTVRLKTRCSCILYIIYGLASKWKIKQVRLNRESADVTFPGPFSSDKVSKCSTTSKLRMIKDKKK